MSNKENLKKVAESTQAKMQEDKAIVEGYKNQARIALKIYVFSKNQLY